MMGQVIERASCLRRNRRNPRVLEEGQVVNFWVEYPSAKGAGGVLANLAPFTSKDYDFWVNHAELQCFC